MSKPTGNSSQRSRLLSFYDVEQSSRALDTQGLSPKECDWFRSLPNEIVLAQFIGTKKMSILKGKDYLNGLRSTTVEAFSKRIVNEDRIILKRLDSRYDTLIDEELNFKDRECSLHTIFRMNFDTQGIRTVSRRRYVHQYDRNGRPKIIIHLISDISNREREGHVRYKFSGKESCIDGFQAKDASKFTPKEKEILSFLVEGLTSEEIAIKLGRSKGTVDRHRKNMIHKANVKDTRKLVRKYLESKLF